MVVAEAMAAGVPVVATNVGGIPEMLGNGQAGALYDVGDIDRLTTILRDVLSDSDYRMSLAKMAKNEACRLFAPEEVARQTVGVYRGILSNTSR